MDELGGTLLKNAGELDDERGGEGKLWGLGKCVFLNMNS